MNLAASDAPRSGGPGAVLSAADDARYAAPALERGLRILEQFGPQARELTAPELVQRLGLPRTTVFRLVSILEKLGYLERAGGHAYRLGMPLLRLGFQTLASFEPFQAGAPVLHRLANQFGHPCSLVVRDGREIVYLVKVAPAMAAASTVTIGTRLPAHATVLGQVLMGDLSDAELRLLYPEPLLKRVSPTTPRTLDELIERVAAAREAGFASSRSFVESDLLAIAAPIRDAHGRVVAALGTTVAADEISEAQVDDYARRLRGGADEITRRIGDAAASAPRTRGGAGA